MNSSTIDFRDDYLRILAVKDGTTRYAHAVKDFRISDGNAAKDRLVSTLRDIGRKRGSIRIILPDRIVKFGVFQVPRMGKEDAQKIVRREISRELGSQAFVMCIRTLERGRTEKQDILAEYALSSDVRPYLSFLKRCGIKPDIVTTGLEGIAALFSRTRPETEGREVVLEIGRDVIEMMVFAHKNLLNYKKVPLQAAVDETQEEKGLDHAQSSKIKMYTLVDSIYNFITEPGNSAPEGGLSRIWISGLGSVEEGITECISEGLGITCSVLSPFDDPAMAPATRYSSLAGLSLIGTSDLPCNLIPPAERSGRQQIVRRALLAAAAMGYLIVIAGSYAMLSRTERDLRIRLEATRAEAALEGKARPAGSDTVSQDVSRSVTPGRPLYGIFRDIANLTPSDISFESLEFEKAGEGMVLNVTAVINSGEQGIRDGALTKLQHALEGASRLRAASAPEISSVSDRNSSVLAVKTAYEVLK